MKHKKKEKNLSYNADQNPSDNKNSEISQKIKELIKADPAQVNAIEDEIVREEIEHLREMARDEGKGGMMA